MTIGRTCLEWTDAAREDWLLGDGSRRKVAVSFYYPVANAAESEAADAAEEAAFGYAALFHPCERQALAWFADTGANEEHLLAWRTGVRLEAAAASANVPCPVALLAPAFGVGRDMYWSQIESLVTSGMVVVAVGSRHESVFTVTADGDFVKQAPSLGKLDNLDYEGWRCLLDMREADLAFVLNRLEEGISSSVPVYGKIDPSRIAGIGHSLGGAAIYRLAVRDRRIRAGILFDPSLHLLDRTSSYPEAPTLLMRQQAASYEELAAAGMNEQLARDYMAGQQYLSGKKTDYPSIVRIEGANHMTFSDIPLIYGEADAKEKQTVIGMLSNAFLAEYLLGAEGKYNSVFQKGRPDEFCAVDGTGRPK